FLHVKRGEKIVGSGELIEKRHLVVFRGIRDQTRGPSAIWVRIGATFLVGLIVLVLWRHARRNVPGFRPTVKDALLLAFALLGSAALAFAGLFCGESLHDRYPRVGAEVLFYLMPFAAGAAIVRSALSAEVALLFSVASGCLVGLVAGDSFFIALYALLTSAVAAGLAARTCGRSSLFRVGAVVGAVGAALVLSTLALEGRKPAAALLPALAAAAAGFVLLPALVVCSVPVLARVFGYLTHFELQKLANLNHPALKDLIIQAPGTYHHSVVVGSLVEAAATSIGANPLLARVCAYYHDLGKTLNPLYFAENERGDGCHEELAPSMSALIVKRHVLDGLELAERWKLPQAVREAIEQHHGTRLVACFFAKARAREGGLRCDESVFRYPGPKPRAREAALVMIADACEASARVLSQVPEGLGELVRRRIEEVFAEGQLDECELTLKDLNAVAAAMAHALEQVYGGRSGQEGGDPSAPRAGAAQPNRQLRIVDAEGDLP
ncbi:MAG TPA: HDIG domain-containing protein, partial [Anaeromyxobacteraceae bacterium]|nr:HDIG domain-containing protein [Anaeromyxobacteraceae bacterium]